MKIAVIAANGGVGKKVVEKALAKGFDVTAFARSANQTATDNFIQKDLFDLTKEDLVGFDAVVDAFGVFQEDLLELHSKSAMHLADLLSGTSTRLLIVGGAGSLYMDEGRTLQLLDTPNFPAAFYPLAKAMTDELDLLRHRSDVDWLFISPVADFGVDYPETGQVWVSGEIFQVNEAGESKISYADYAQALVDEIAHPSHHQKRIQFIGK